MEIKWIAIMMALWVTVIGIAGVSEAYFKTECRQSYANSNKTAEEIASICK